jgi:DUF1680 family protein
MTNRREFLRFAAAASAVLARDRPAAGSTRLVDRRMEHGQPLQEFGYGQVSLAPGLQERQLEETHSVLMHLDDDDLMKVYRQRAGLPAPGCNLGGWYSAETLGAETFGQWLSALSRYYDITKDEPTRAKVQRLTHALDGVVEPTGKLFGDPKLTTGPAYHFDKLTCGLIDAHAYAGAANALDILARLTSAARPLLPGRATDFLTENYGDHESYTLPENHFIAWQRGGSDDHLAFARQYLYESFFGPLADGQNVLAGRHAYSHVNSLCSAAKAYLVLGDERYLKAAKNGFAFIAAQSYATGGWGPNEAFIPYKKDAATGQEATIDSLGQSLARTHWHFETCCGSYAHFKLARYLLRITRDSIYGDSMERVMYNTVLGARALHQDGRAFYYSDYAADGHKVYFDGNNGVLPSEWPCCSGTLPQVAADYSISTYFRSTDAIYVNLFIPSTVVWQQHGSRVSLSQSGSYPLSEGIKLFIEVSKPTYFTVYLRIPGWAQNPSIEINGKWIKDLIRPGAFAALKREWRSGDHIYLELPHKLILQSVDSQHPDTVAPVYGPLVLFTVSAENRKITREQLLSARRRAAESEEWTIDALGTEVRLTPFWKIDRERYSTYIPLVT